MQGLFRTLQDRDIGHLRIIAELWGIDLPSVPSVQAARHLVSAMLDPALAREQADSLPPEARLALDALLASPGRIPFADLTRRFGPLREMGPGRRDREKPWRTPASPLETLWYRGWLARAFAETPAGLQEFAFVPSDLASLLPPRTPSPSSPPGEPAPEPSNWIPARRTSPDDATTLLAALRRRAASALPLPPPRMNPLRPYLHIPDSADLLLTLLHEDGVLTGPPFRPAPEGARRFLDSSRGEAAARLVRAWEGSQAWNDLAHAPGLESPGERWPNDPLAGRRAVLKYLWLVPEGTWWDLAAFAEGIRAIEPGFQRPGGDFDSWYLQKAGTGEFLRGFEAWDAVEGGLIRFMIDGPLHWMGACDLDISDSGRTTAFRRTPLSSAIWGAETVSLADEPMVPISLSADGRIVVPSGASRVHRYQISRVAAWTGFSAAGYEFSLTPSSLKAADGQGLGSRHVLAILEAATGRRPAPTLAQAIERAIARGPEARLERTLILRVGSPRLLQSLRSDRACARLLGESLGPTAVRIGPRDWEKLRTAAARLGILIEPPEL